MSIFRSILPGSTPNWLKDKSDVTIWREKVLQSLLLVTFFAAISVYAIAVPQLLQAGDFSTLIMYTVALAIALSLPLFRKLPYTFRAVVIISLFILLGTQNFWMYGPTRNGTTYLIAAMILSGMLLGLRSGILVIALSIIITAFFTFAPTNGWITPPSDQTLLASTRVGNWISILAHAGFLGSFVIISVNIIITGLQQALTNQKNLAEQLSTVNQNLEKRVLNRTQDLERRLSQLRTAAKISGSISTLRDPQLLLQQVADLVLEEFHLYYVGIFLVDETNENAWLRAGTGEAGQKMLALQHKLAVGSNSMIGWTTVHGQARIALDTGLEAVRFNNPHLPLTRSEMALPIKRRDRVVGAISIQSTEPDAFDENDILILEGIADSIGIALENATLIAETQQNLDEIRALNRAYLADAWEEAQEVHGKLAFTYHNPVVSPNDSHSSQINIPLTLRDQAIGTITIETGGGSVEQEDLEFIDAIATQTAIALENARLIEETQRRVILESKVNEISAAFSRAGNIESILRATVQELGQLPNITEVSIELIPPQESDAEIKISREVLS